MAEIMSKVGFGSSDYGNSFADFENEWMNAITPQTTVIVLGDARSNNLDPRADILRRIGERSKRLVWLNPKAAWPGVLAIPKCSATRPSAASCANAPPQSSSNARYRISWRRINRPPERRIVPAEQPFAPGCAPRYNFVSDVRHGVWASRMNLCQQSFGGRNEFHFASWPRGHFFPVRGVCRGDGPCPGARPVRR